MSADTLTQRLGRAHAGLGTLRFALILLASLLVAAGLVIALALQELRWALLPLVAALATIWAALRLLERPRPDLLWGLVIAAGAAVLWAQTFGVLPYPIQGAL